MALYPGHSAPGGRALVFHWLGGWMHPTERLDVIVKSNFLCLVPWSSNLSQLTACFWNGLQHDTCANCKLCCYSNSVYVMICSVTCVSCVHRGVAGQTGLLPEDTAAFQSATAASDREDRLDTCKTCRGQGSCWQCACLSGRSL